MCDNLWAMRWMILYLAGCFVLIGVLAGFAVMYFDGHDTPLFGDDTTFDDVPEELPRGNHHE